MAQPGVQDDDGSFQRPSLDEIEQRFVDKAEEELGQSVDLSQGSPIKQIFDVVILEHNYLWQLLEDVYYSAYYGHGYEDQLDKLLALSQFSRIPRRAATGEVTFSVNTANPHDVIIPEGTRVASYETEDRPPIPYKTTEPVRLEAGHAHVANVPIRACEPWETDLDSEWLGKETNVAANTIETFQTSIAGVDEVTNPYPTGSQSREKGYSYIEGRDRESDKEFRERFENSMGLAANASLHALRSAVRNLDGVRNARIEENTTMIDNRDGSDPDLPPLPPKSFRLTVLGDEHNDVIAQTITDTRSAGIESYGEDSGDSTVVNGDETEEYWDWAEQTEIYVDVTVTHDDEFPSDGSLDVENAIIDYIGGETAQEVYHDGLGLGEDVIRDMVFKQAMNVEGVWRANVEIGKDPAATGFSDIFIEDKQAAVTSPDSINVFTEYSDRVA